MPSERVQNFDEVARLRSDLELNVQKLRQSLRYWQTCEAEYKELEEAINGLPPDASREEIYTTARDFEGQVVKEKEIRNLLDHDAQVQRSNAQILGLLSRRVEYVQRNEDTLRGQLDNAETRLRNLGSSDDHEVGAGLEPTEIIEELDEDDNVVSSTLRKAGLTESDLKVGQQHDSSESTLLSAEPPQGARSGSTSTRPALAAQDDRRLPLKSAERHDLPAKSAQKAVSFSQDTKAPSPNRAPTELNNHKESRDTNLAELVRGSFNPDERVYEVDENENLIDMQDPVIPEHESPEDAAMRRRMIQYNMNEMNEIVAELELEEVGEEEEDDADGMDDEADSETSNEDEDDDEHGMSRKSHITAAYRQEMAELERKLNATALQNLGPDTNISKDQIQAEVHDIQEHGAISGSEAHSKPDDKTSKAVRFSQNIDVVTNSEQAFESKSSPSRSSEPVTAVENTIVERTAANCPPARPSIEASRKTSRFKSDRAAANLTDGQIRKQPLAADIIEHPMQPGIVEADQNDSPGLRNPEPTGLQNEPAQNCYSQRHDPIHKQDSFVKNHVDTGSGTGPPPTTKKKQSLFKSARARADQM